MYPNREMTDAMTASTRTRQLSSSAAADPACRTLTGRARAGAIEDREPILALPRETFSSGQRRRRPSHTPCPSQHDRRRTEYATDRNGKLFRKRSVSARRRSVVTQSRHLKKITSYRLEKIAMSFQNASADDDEISSEIPSSFALSRRIASSFAASCPRSPGIWSIQSSSPSGVAMLKRDVPVLGGLHPVGCADPTSAPLPHADHP